MLGAGSGKAQEATEAGATKDLAQPVKRLYMGRGPHKQPVGELDFAKLLSQQALVTWGQLLRHLPEQQVHQLLATAR